MHLSDIRLIEQLIDEHCSHVEFCKNKTPKILQNLEAYLTPIIEGKITEIDELTIRSTIADYLVSHLKAFDRSHKQIVNNAKLTFTSLHSIIKAHPKLRLTLASNSFFRDKLKPIEKGNSHIFSQLIVDAALLKNTTNLPSAAIGAYRIKLGLKEYRYECDNLCEKVVECCLDLKFFIKDLYNPGTNTVDASS
jgi:SPX domain protein involved in polyphosphate accumulation